MLLLRSPRKEVSIAGGSKLILRGHPRSFLENLFKLRSCVEGISSASWSMGNRWASLHHITQSNIWFTVLQWFKCRKELQYKYNLKHPRKKNNEDIEYFRSACPSSMQATSIPSAAGPSETVLVLSPTIVFPKHIKVSLSLEKTWTASPPAPSTSLSRILAGGCHWLN